MSTYNITVDTGTADMTAVQLWRTEGDKRILVDSQIFESAKLPPAQESSLEYIRRTYDVPAYAGFTIKFKGKPGVIVGAADASLLIQLEGMQSIRRFHPTWEIQYFKEAL